MSTDISLSSLLPAKSAEQVRAIESGEVKVNKFESHRIRKEMRARLVAQEYVRNGMVFKNAWKTVTGITGYASDNILKTLGAQTDIFMEELSTLVSKSDVDRDRALNLLWTMVNTSILDFVNDNGEILSIPELRKLPRAVQIMISDLDVTVTQETIKDANGNLMCDDNGSPYLRTKQKVRIKVPEKMAALNQLAQLMRWVGPAGGTMVNINIGRMISDADARQRRVSQVYDNETQQPD
jgi:hypothetical protein